MWILMKSWRMTPKHAAEVISEAKQNVPDLLYEGKVALYTDGDFLKLEVDTSCPHARNVAIRVCDYVDP